MPITYGLDKDGNIALLRKTDDKTDKLIALDDKGNETDKSIEVEKGILDQKKEGTSSRGVSYDYYKVGNDEQATNLFEFVAQNSNVEWSQVKFGTKSNYISTGHLPHSEPGGSHLLRELVIGKYTIREHIHSHPTSTDGPSGYKPGHKSTGDKNHAIWINRYAPRVQLKVYEKKTGKYIRYNHQKVVGP